MRTTLIVLTVMAMAIAYAGENAEGPRPPEGIGVGLRERPGMGRNKWQGEGREFMKELGAGGFGWRGQFLGFYLERLTKDSELARRVGITEEQIEKLKQAVEPLAAKRKELEEQREKASTEQAKLLAKESALDEEAIMTVVEKLGQINTELAKLSVKQLIAVKSVFNQEEIAKIREKIRENIHAEAEKRVGEIRERMKEKGKDGWVGEKGKEEKEKPWKQRNGEKEVEKGNPRRHRDGAGGVPVRGDI